MKIKLVSRLHSERSAYLCLPSARYIFDLKDKLLAKTLLNCIEVNCIEVNKLLLVGENGKRRGIFVFFSCLANLMSQTLGSGT